jgi:nickel/cobalt transporter (NicO) family protein
MIDLNAILESGHLPLLLWTAVGLGFLHTILGPDHYVPFVMMAKAQNWSRTKTAWITTLCGLGHVGSSVVIGAILAVTGMAFTEWDGGSWVTVQEVRGGVAAWLLMGLGAALLIWGIVRAWRGHRHTHSHLHEDGTTHADEHAHVGDHMHVHEAKARRFTPWVLFAIFVFGPCESLIPLMLAAWAAAGLGGTVLVAGAFSLVTVLTILVTVFALMMGVSRIPLGSLDRWSTALAGVSLLFCGAAIQWMGL